MTRPNIRLTRPNIRQISDCQYKDLTGSMKFWDLSEIFWNSFCCLFSFAGPTLKNRNSRENQIPQTMTRLNIRQISDWQYKHLWFVYDFWRSFCCLFSFAGPTLKIRKSHENQIPRTRTRPNIKQISDWQYKGLRFVWDFWRSFCCKFSFAEPTFHEQRHDLLPVAGPTMKIRKSHKNQNSKNNETTKYQTNLRLAI